MDIFPAIDISGGRVVRLQQGNYGQMTHYTISPLEAAGDFQSQGARFLHVVDLDGAKTGETTNFDTISQIAAASGLFMEVGGGIRDEERICKYLDAGAGRVILGTAALRQPQFLRDMVEKYGSKIAVGVDARDGKVAVSGWLDVTDVDALEFCRQLSEWGVQTVIYTDIAADGMLSGPNRQIYPRLTAIPNLDIVASGGVTSLDDVIVLRRAGCRAAIIGKALYSGKIDLTKALAMAKEEDI
jgi:phosphoribosylformimino-5-aminoimidazole carboxamide ribotide isomerase